MTLSAEKFYLPYQFVQVTGKCNGKDVSLAAVEALKTGSCETGKAGAGARHDVWLKGHRSGRIVCRLTTETPTFVGAKRQADTAPVEVSHATDARDGQGMPIIPGSSLRGMIGSIVETLSQSALRVLEPRTMSVRAQMKEALSAIGMIAHDPETGDVVLKPLTLPVLKGHSTEGGDVFDVPRRWVDLYGLEDAKDLRSFLPFYFDGYQKQGDGVCVKHGSAVQGVLRGSPRFSSSDIYVLAGADNNEALLSVPYRIDERSRSAGPLRIKLQANHRAYVKGTGNLTMVGAKPRATVPLVAVERHKAALRNGVVVGWLRMLDMHHALDSVPTGKKHELFVPHAEFDWSIPFADDVVSTFDRICNDRFEASEGVFPFVPLGGVNAADRARDKRWLRDGDLVFFDVNDDLEVSQVSFSSIWRRPVAGNLEAAFNDLSRRGDGKASALTPYGSNRGYLSPAETLLGVVRESKKSDAEKRTSDPLPALASRLRFHDARLTSGEPKLARAPITLQILSSPKPPSPAFYFQGKVSKQQLDLNADKPQGRKYYLHHPKQQIDAAMYVSRHDDPGLRKQKARIRPLLPGNAFEFHVDFENLSDSELHLLLTSLRPAAEFRHRIGMGKPLGLGTVRVDVLGVFEVDRCARYGSDSLDGPRYEKAWVASDQDFGIVDTQRYATESGVGTVSVTKELRQGEYDMVLGTSADLVDGASLAALRKIGAWADGNPLSLEENIAVCYPRTQDQLAAFAKGGDAEMAESKLYAWNVENDNPDRQFQCLGSVPTMTKPMQPLFARSTERADAPKGNQGNRPQGSKPSSNIRPGAARRH